MQENNDLFEQLVLNSLSTHKEGLDFSFPLIVEAVAPSMR